MKVILLEDVKKIGKKNEIKEVKEGYATNLLFPRKLAIPATKEGIKSHEAKQKVLEAQNNAYQSRIVLILEEIRGKKVILKEKANEQGHLFKKIPAKQIVEAVKESIGIEIKEEWLSLEPIKSTGVYDIALKAEDKESIFTLVVEEKK